MIPDPNFSHTKSSNPEEPDAYIETINFAKQVNADLIMIHVQYTLNLPPFTLIGATTRFGDLSAPLRIVFGVVFQISIIALTI